MRTLLSRAIQIDPSFHVALGMIVILGIGAMFCATAYYVARARANRVPASAVAATIARPPAASTSPPAPAAAQPGVAPPAAVTSPVPSIIDQLLREGKEFRERGDTTNALA